MNILDLINRWTSGDGINAREQVLRAFRFGHEWVPCLANLPGASEVWGYADLRGIDLQGQRIANATLVCAALDLAKLDDADLEGIVFDHSSLLYTSFNRAHIKKCQFVSTNANRATFEGSHLLECLFMHANLSTATFQDAQFEKVDLGHTNCALSNFAGARLARCELGSADFARVDFSTTTFLDTSLEGARLFKTVLP